MAQKQNGPTAANGGAGIVLLGGSTTPANSKSLLCAQPLGTIAVEIARQNRWIETGRKAVADSLARRTHDPVNGLPRDRKPLLGPVYGRALSAGGAA